MTLGEYLNYVRGYRPSEHIHYCGAPFGFAGATAVAAHRSAIEHLCNGELETALGLYLEECTRFLETRGTTFNNYWIRPGIIMNLKLILRQQYDMGALEYLYYLRGHLTPWCNDKLGQLVKQCDKIFEEWREQLGKAVVVAIAQKNLEQFSTNRPAGGDTIRGEVSWTMKATTEQVRKSHALCSYQGLSLFGSKLPEQLGAENAIELFRITAREAENRLRRSCGVPNVGEGWVSETELYVTVREHLGGKYRVIHHGRPKWLGRQHFDVWIPEIGVAIEYNGLQHSEPVEYFGGAEGLTSTRMRDEKKRSLAADNGVRLIEVDQDTNISNILAEIQSLASSREG
jgi:hypothetical protein